MTTSLKMVFAFHFLLLVIRILAGTTEASQDEHQNCTASTKCSRDGPSIRFPFRLKNHPEKCGYPGFELSCTKNNQTMLELPSSAKLPVENINYATLEIRVRYTDLCLPEQLHHSLVASPFEPANFTWEDFASRILFSCSLNKISDWKYPIPCHFLPGNKVYAFRPDDDVGDFDLASCSKILNASGILYPDKGHFSMKWTETICGDCKAQGGKCRPKSNSTEDETECIGKPPKPQKAVPRTEEVTAASRTPEVVGIVVGSHFLLLMVLALYHVYGSYKSQRQNRINIEKFLRDYAAVKPSRYPYADIKKITHQFKDKLGQGGYGTVYKGKLSSEVFVAVKMLNDSNGSGEEFVNEVSTIGRIHHVNVVRLVGYCADRSKRALIYEFLPNKSLDEFIFSSTAKEHSLSWEKLQDIALGIARGIEYLHQGCDQRILHFDIKPHNILLDHNFNPKISDFGLAKLCSKEQSAVSMTTARGTIGYIAPEVLSRNFGDVSYKSDVYSFGMLLLEMVGGRKNIDATVENSSQVYFPEWVYNHLGQGEDLQIRIEEEGDSKIAKKLTIVGLWCIQWHPVDRPSMKMVVQMLEREDDALVMPANPFTATNPPLINTSRPRRPLQELAVISELE